MMLIEYVNTVHCACENDFSSPISLQEGVYLLWKHINSCFDMIARLFLNSQLSQL